MIDKLTKIKYEKIDLSKLTEKIISDDLNVTKFLCDKLKVKIERHNMQTSLYFMFTEICILIGRMKEILSSLPINNSYPIVNLVLDLTKIYGINRYSLKISQSLENLPTSLKKLIFVYHDNDSLFFNNKYGNYNFLFEIKKIPFDCEVKLCVRKNLYNVDFEKNQATLTCGEVVHVITYNSKPDVEIIHRV